MKCDDVTDNCSADAAAAYIVTRGTAAASCASGSCPRVKAFQAIEARIPLPTDEERRGLQRDNAE